MVMGTNEHRRSIRLKDYDYAQVGAYFVTIVVQDRKCLFGEIIGGVMQLNAAGLMAQAVWEDLPNYYAGIDPDSFVVMPNHIHGIVVLVRAGPWPALNRMDNHRGLPLPKTHRCCHCRMSCIGLRL